MVDFFTTALDYVKNYFVDFVVVLFAIVRCVMAIVGAVKRRRNSDKSVSASNTVIAGTNATAVTFSSTEKANEYITAVGLPTRVCLVYADVVSSGSSTGD